MKKLIAILLMLALFTVANYTQQDNNLISQATEIVGTDDEDLPNQHSD
ncbi:hypothetical protein [Ornithinibacillus californiensis]|nr:hypothetical protein [Ornithinibacillus californiensis]